VWISSGSSTWTDPVAMPTRSVPTSTEEAKLPARADRLSQPPIRKSRRTSRKP